RVAGLAAVVADAAAVDLRLDPGRRADGGGGDHDLRRQVASRRPTTHSTWWVCGNMSTRSKRATEYGQELTRTWRSRASVAGSHDTYTTRGGPASASQPVTPPSQPARGGSSTTASTPSSAATPASAFSTGAQT